MDVDHFKQLVSRLERESAASPGAYRSKVAALALLGFCILALLFGAVGFGLLMLAGIAVALVVTGGSALILLLKLGKLLWLLAIPLWLLVKSGVQALFIRLPEPQGREISRADAPALFEALERMRVDMRGPRFHHVLVTDDVNAAVVQRPALGLVGWPRNTLLLGLPLLDSMPPEEALAVVAHEYGHLAGSHGRFSAFIYRLRHTWGTVQAYTDQIQGWLGRMVAPLVRWYVPYFNAYTFVLARADEVQADAAAARLVGVSHAAHALKRVNVVSPRHERFMQQTFERALHDPTPPADLMHRWAEHALQPVPGADAERWLGMALDREGHYADTHPTLRARLAQLAVTGAGADEPPPALAGSSAAQAWLGELADKLRQEFQSRWAEQVAEPWAARHAELQQRRKRLAELQAGRSLSADEELERIRLLVSLEPAQDQRAALAAFNAAHADHALGLFLEGSVRLDHGDAGGLALLERAGDIDGDAIKPACERAHAYLVEQRQPALAETWLARWRARDAFETQRRQQLETMDGKDALAPHGMPDELLAAVRQVVDVARPADVAELHLVRRPIPVDPSAVQWIVGVHLTWWARRRGRQAQVIDRLIARQWPVPLVFVTLDGRFARWKQKMRALQGARLL